MRAIQKFLPRPRHTEIHRIFVNADPATAWQTARHIDMAQTPWIKLLFDIRAIPNRLKGQPADANTHLGVDDITQRDTGFIILQETPGAEVVVGSIGQFWHLNIPFEKITPETFRDFNRPGFGKIAWSITVAPYLKGSTIAVELRTSATDDDSWTKLSRYYHIIGIGSKLIRTSVMSHLEATLGKMRFPDNDTRPLPGDELIPESKYGITYHRNIEAPVSIVWRYLMQLGCDRAGWYSVDMLDNGGKPSIDHLVDGWEDRQAGGEVQATPEGGSFHVYAVQHESHFILGGKTTRLGGPFEMTWSFVLEPIGDDGTHLISRARMIASPPWAEWLLGNIAYPPIHGLMSKVQLDHIRAYAERDARN